MSGTAGLLIGALGTALTAILGGYVAWRKLEPENRNTDANTTKTIVEASGTVIAQLKAEIARLGADHSLMRLELSALVLHVEELESIMRTSGLVPPPRPLIDRRKPTL